MLAILADPNFIYTLIPLGVIFLGIVTFEVAMAVTISTLPRSRFKQRWTLQEQRRVIRVFLSIFSVWPMAGAVVLSHLYLPWFVALIVYAIVLAVIILGLRWFRLGIKERRLVMAGHCENCLYDLRASNASETCPECGASIQDHPSIKQPRKRRCHEPVSSSSC